MRRPLIHTIPHEWLCATCLSPSQQDSLRHAPDCAPPPPPIHAKPPHPIAPTVLGIWFLSSQLQSCFKRKLYDLIVQVIFARLLTRCLALLAAFGTLANSLRSDNASVLIRTLLRCSARPNGGFEYLTARPLRELRPKGLFASLTSRGLGFPHSSSLTSRKGTARRATTPDPLTPHPSLLTPTTSLLTPHSSLLTPHSSLLTPHSCCADATLNTARSA